MSIGSPLHAGEVLACEVNGVDGVGGRGGERQLVVGQFEGGVEESPRKAPDLQVGPFGDHSHPISGDGVAAGAVRTGSFVVDLDRPSSKVSV
jgi:hypothetical protein